MNSLSNSAQTKFQRELWRCCLSQLTTLGSSTPIAISGTTKICRCAIFHNYSGVDALIGGAIDGTPGTLIKLPADGSYMLPDVGYDFNLADIYFIADDAPTYSVIALNVLYSQLK